MCSTLYILYKYKTASIYRLLQHIKLRWLSIYNSIDRLLKVYKPLPSYFCEIAKEDEDEDEDTGTTCSPVIKTFFSSNMSKCTLYFLHQILFDIQTKNLELPRYSTTIADLHKIISSLLKKLHDRLKQKYFIHNTRLILNSMSTVEQEEVISSFTKYLSNIIKYINKYCKEHSLLAETLSIFGILFL